MSLQTDMNWVKARDCHQPAWVWTVLTWWNGTLNVFNCLTVCISIVIIKLDPYYYCCSLWLNTVVVKLLLNYHTLLSPNCWTFSLQLHHCLTATLSSLSTKIYSALTPKPALTCIHSPYNAMSAPSAIAFPRFNSTQQKFHHLIQYLYI